MTSPRIILVAGLLAVFAQFALALFCYHCESETNANCGENFDSEGITQVDCEKMLPPRYLWSLGVNNTATGCAKIFAKKQNKTIIVRQCYYGDISKKGQLCIPSPLDYEVQYESCEVCKTENCNGASTTNSIAFFVVIAATFISIFIK